MTSRLSGEGLVETLWTLDGPGMWPMRGMFFTPTHYSFYNRAESLDRNATEVSVYDKKEIGSLGVIALDFSTAWSKLAPKTSVAARLFTYAYGKKATGVWVPGRAAGGGSRQWEGGANRRSASKVAFRRRSKEARPTAAKGLSVEHPLGQLKPRRGHRCLQR